MRDFGGFGVEGFGCGAEFQRGEVLLGLGHELFGHFRRAADEQEQEAGGEGVEGASVADLGAAGEEALDARHGCGGGEAGGFVEDEEAVHLA